MMEVIETGLKGCLVLEPQIYNDGRGYFFESYNEKRFQEKTGIEVRFIQDNQSKSDRGVLRGLHYQSGEYAQAKLVRVIKGKALDVVVDIRPESVTFGKTFSVILSEENNKQLFVPRGFAHGFSVLEDNTIFSYKCDNYYNKASEGGIIYNDADLNIDWMLKQEEVVLSEKDQYLQNFKSLRNEI